MFCLFYVSVSWQYNEAGRCLCTHDGTLKSLSITVRPIANESWNITFVDTFKQDFHRLFFIRRVFHTQRVKLCASGYVEQHNDKTGL